MAIRSGRRAALAILLAAWCGPARADLDDIETTYRAATERVAKHLKFDWLDGSKAGEYALTRAWTRIADWTVAYLNRHPGASAKKLKSAAPNGSQSSFEAVLLAPKVFLVSAGVIGFGTVFIVDGSDGAYRLAWSIRGGADREAFPLLSVWRAAAMSDKCKEPDDDNPGLCGTLGGAITRLPDDSAGHPRFTVNATYAQMAETTVSAQLSFWRWDGHTAHPLFIKRYLYNFEDDGIRLDGDLMTIRASDGYRTFFNCGTCIGRQMDWRLRLADDRVEDLGMRPLIPELDAVDEFLYRAAHNRTMDDAASPKAQAAANALMTNDAYRDDQDHEFVSIGMMGDHSVRHRGQDLLVCLQTDDAGVMMFTMEPRGGGFYVTGMTVSAADSDWNHGCPHDKP